MPFQVVNGVRLPVPDGYQYVTNPGSMSPPTLQPIPGYVPGQTSATGTPPVPITPVAPPATPLTPNQLAWQNAQNAYAAQKKDVLQTYGITPQGGIDPNNRFGLVRQTLGRYAQQLELARMANQGRGIGHRGLANRPQRLIRFMLGATSSDQSRRFLASLADIENRVNTLGPRPTT